MLAMFGSKILPSSATNPSVNLHSSVILEGSEKYSISQASGTPQPSYNTVHYNIVLEISRFSVGSQMVISDLFSYITIHFTLNIARFG